ncbi:unnamed protein product [Brachionus calyciflorus]|uniref:Uncharacterized protein n=1 Tax=Brachionus calyciflorus TaxID=104777 RepID=A0A814GYR2_9BILA|nr:unnamed protein product [Brachionus calyciflorus]
MSIIENKKVFGDPTYDVTFKMLFGNNKNKDLAISLINNLLNFHDEDQVNDITFLSVEIPISCEKEIKTIIDMRCITNKGEEIIVEMQRLFHNLVLPRTQYYMAKSISYKMSTGESDQYHIKLTKTYLLMISRQNLFKLSYQLKDDIYYEKTAVPIIKELDVELPIKEQWLNFFDKCGSATEIPDNVDDIIKKAYRQMEMYKWPKELEMIYDMAQKKESLDLFYLKENTRKRALYASNETLFNEGMADLKNLPLLKYASQTYPVNNCDHFHWAFGLTSDGAFFSFG